MIKIDKKYDVNYVLDLVKKFNKDILHITNNKKASYNKEAHKIVNHYYT